MAKLIYSAIASLDGYIEDDDGRFDWAVPDDEVHSFINDLQRPVGGYLYGRRMYETMAGWETYPTLAAQSQLMRDFAQIWQGADKIVYSTTLENPGGKLLSGRRGDRVGGRRHRARRSRAGTAARGRALRPRPDGQRRATGAGGDAVGALRRPAGRHSGRAPGVGEPGLRARPGEIGCANSRRSRRRSSEASRPSTGSASSDW